MRLIHTSDLHGNLKWYRWLLDQSPDFNLICIAGDLLDQGRDAPFDRQVRDISRLLRRFVAPVALCSGNHDLGPYDDPTCGPTWMHALQRPNLWLDGDQFQLMGQSFRCIGWGQPLGRATPCGKEIWITHAPPTECKVGQTRSHEDWGDYEFGEVCRTGNGPRLALVGHVHEPNCSHDSVGRTKVLNPGHTAVAPWPNHIIIDLNEGTAEVRRFPCSSGKGAAPAPHRQCSAGTTF